MYLCAGCGAHFTTLRGLAYHRGQCEQWPDGHLAPEYSDEDYEWHDWTGTFDKVAYEVELKDGRHLLCWPNAGVLYALDGTREVDITTIARLRRVPWTEAEERAWDPSK